MSEAKRKEDTCPTCTANQVQDLYLVLGMIPAGCNWLASNGRIEIYSSDFEKLLEITGG